MSQCSDDVWPQNALNRQGSRPTCRYLMRLYQLIEKQSNIQLQKAPYHIVCVPILSEAMLQNHRFDLRCQVQTKWAPLQKKKYKSILQPLCMDMQYTQKEATKRPMLLGYTVIGMGKDAKFTRACLNSGRIGGKNQWRCWFETKELFNKLGNIQSFNCYVLIRVTVDPSRPWEHWIKLWMGLWAIAGFLGGRKKSENLEEIHAVTGRTCTGTPHRQ